ncbi:hypothetical protein FNU76_17825 [Chitinimonas arctica]|uniref:Uncharacterized protein n=1 Tax=Chitinimonas arctica TaxID=2594795 RepID=A0A516SIT5_9NEIS|nr:hypothetical protein [Chitinimonas arctica]QDQ28053.1 hypothetical protein FNU76_17825 [Chitinimonas arctica]
MFNSSSRLAVVINLDYLSLPYDVCRLLWVVVEKAMVEAGFVLDGRVFVAHNDPAAAERARLVLKTLEPTFESLGLSQFEAVRDFYCFDLGTRVDLHMLDAAEVVELIEIAA